MISKRCLLLDKKIFDIRETIPFKGISPLAEIFEIGNWLII